MTSRKSLSTKKWTIPELYHLLYIESDYDFFQRAYKQYYGDEGDEAKIRVDMQKTFCLEDAPIYIRNFVKNPPILIA